MRRGLLLQALAGHIDRAVDRGAGERARDLLALGDGELAAAVGAAPGFVRERIPRATQQLAGELERGVVAAICAHDRGWPGEALARLGPAAPRALFLRGEAGLLAAPAERRATIVGARRAGPYGREVATALAGELAAAGIEVMSGMAFGIDAAAHRGALEAGGASTAVLAAGPERPYPRSAARLHRELSATGLVVSELPPGSATFRWAFPARNRIMAAMAGITVVVEAAERSGSLITAEMAVECGRAVGAVPGPVTSWRSSGANLLIADGARLIRGGVDVLEELLGPGSGSRPPVGPQLAGAALEVLRELERGASTVGALTARGVLRPGEVAAALGRLELAGYARRESSGAWTRTALLPPKAR